MPQNIQTTKHNPKSLKRPENLADSGMNKILSETDAG
jgi:hypothetical protein